MTEEKPLLSPCRIDLRVNQLSAAYSIKPEVFGQRSYENILMDAEVTDSSTQIEQSLRGLQCQPAISNNLAPDESEILVGQITFSDDGELFISIALTREQFDEVKHFACRAEGLTLAVEFGVPHVGQFSIVGHTPIQGFTLNSDVRSVTANALVRRR